MSELPEGWEEVPLSMLCIFNPRHNSSEDRKQEISFVPMPAVSDTGGRIEDHGTKVLGDVWKGYTHFQEGDVIFAKITPCMENGKIAVARGLHGGIACGSTEFHVLRPFTGVNAKYLWYFLRQRDFRIEAERHMTGAVGQRRVPKAYLEKYIIPLPPANEQCRIVTKLDSLFEHTRRAREELSHIPRLIENYKKTILEAAFRGDLTKDWRGTKELVGWHKKPLSKLLAEPLANGRSVPDGNGFPVLRLTALRNQILDLSERKLGNWDRSQAARYIVQSGDFFVSRGNGSLDLVARGSYIEAVDEEVAFPDTMIRIRPDHAKIYTPLLYHQWSDVGVRSQIVSMAKTTAGIYKVSQSDLNRVQLIVPPLEEQRKIVRRVEETLNWLDAVGVEQRQATYLLDHLDQANLAKAFHGELVSQDPNDEPATVLLERIQADRAAPPCARRGRREKAVTTQEATA